MLTLALYIVRMFLLFISHLRYICGSTSGCHGSIITYQAITSVPLNVTQRGGPTAQYPVQHPFIPTLQVCAFFANASRFAIIYITRPSHLLAGCY